MVIEAKIHEALLILLESTSKEIVYYCLGVLSNLMTDNNFKYAPLHSGKPTKKPSFLVSFPSSTSAITMTSMLSQSLSRPWPPSSKAGTKTWTPS